MQSEGLFSQLLDEAARLPEHLRQLAQGSRNEVSNFGASFTSW